MRNVFKNKAFHFMILCLCVILTTFSTKISIAQTNPDINKVKFFAKPYQSKEFPSEEIIKYNIDKWIIGSVDLKQILGKHENAKDDYSIYYIMSGPITPTKIDVLRVKKLDTDVWVFSSSDPRHPLCMKMILPDPK